MDTRVSRLFVMATAGLVVAMAVASGQETPPPRSLDAFEDTLVARERALQTAVARSDGAALAPLLLPEGTWTTRQGFVPMNMMADGLSGYDVSRWEIINPHVTRLSDDSAVVVYVWSGTGTLGGTPLPATALASTVWTRRAGVWRAAHHQQTELVRE
jgi:hypothetical protein